MKTEEFPAKDFRGQYTHWVRERWLGRPVFSRGCSHVTPGARLRAGEADIGVLSPVAPPALLLFHRRIAQSGWPGTRSVTVTVRVDVRTATHTMVER
jgi:hypothetical protein